MAFRKILVPHDGSKPSDRALDAAIELARMSEGVQIIMLHVTPEIPLPPMFERQIRSRKTGEVTTTSAYLKELYQDMKSSALKTLAERKHKCEKAGISAETKAVIGYPSDKIIEYANENGIELIVIGTTGLKGLSKFKALGSVARGVSERAKCPVMLVH